jgi:cytochrome P450
MYQLSLPSSVSIQEKLSREARENQGLGNEKSFDELPYLDAVVKEGLRCFPPIPMSQPRYVPEGGRTIDGYLLPAKTVISGQAWSVHRINAETFEDPDEFCPERWLCVDERKRAKMNKAFFAFGLGARGCTGRQ